MRVHAHVWSQPSTRDTTSRIAASGVNSHSITLAFFSNVNADFAGPFQQNSIEFLPTHLIRLSPRNLSHVGEVNVTAGAAIVRIEARTALLWKTCGLDPLGHTQSRERVVGSRQQRLADMKSGERVTLKENDRMTTLP